jgi:thymidylate synthase ThyX
MSIVELVWATPDAEALITKMARVSAPANENNMDTAPKLLRYLIKHSHWSPFEMANMCLEIHTTRAISAQIIRHRSFSFQEFCLSGDSRITISSEKGIVQRIPIKDLFEKWEKPTFKARYARAYDTQLQRFIIAPIKSVYNSGKKTVYRFEIVAPASKKTISCTREHRVLTKEKGFVPFGIAYDEQLTVALNGDVATSLPYQDPKVLQASAWMGSTQFAHEYGIAEVTARKWFRKYGITPCKPNNAAASSIDIGFSARLSSFMKWARNNVRAEQCQECGHDGSVNRLEVSHVKAHDGNPDLAFDETNLQTLCSTCHRKYDIEEQGKTYGWTLGMTAKWGKISSQTYIGVEETYDIEMDHPTHNFVADGVVVHNSQRYADINLLGSTYVPHLRRQDTKNRQNSVDDLDAEMTGQYYRRISSLFEEAEHLYKEMVSSGVAKECARNILPLASPTRIYMNGSLRSWITYIALREKHGTQMEHMQIAKDAKKIFCGQFPTIAEALGGNDPWEI